MLSIKKMGRGSEDYYLDLADYYAAGDGEPPGRWLGQGCPAWAFGERPARSRSRCMRGSPSPFAAAAGSKRRCGQSSARLGPDLLAAERILVRVEPERAGATRRLEQLHHDAVAHAIELAESQLAYSRTDKGGTGWTPVKLIVAAFEHSTSRNLDPQLHTHCLVLNVGVDASGRTRSLYSKPLFVNRDLLGAYYRAELAYQLRSLGFHVRRHDRSFEIEGISAKLLAGASTRRWEIVSRLIATGRSGGAAAAVATLDTRRAKGVIPPRTSCSSSGESSTSNEGLAT